MNRIFTTYFLLIFISSFSFAQTAAVNLEVLIPSDTTMNKLNVFVAGSFNCWKPNDSLYMMRNTGENLYSLEIPVFEGKVYEYKYTGGNWASVEFSTAGSEIENRKFLAAKGITIRDTVANWKPAEGPKKTDSSLVLNAKQIEELTKMKNEMETKIAERTKTAGDILKKASENMLSDNPDMEMRKKFHDEIISTVSFALELAADAMWKTAAVLTPEQKKAILQELNKPDAPNDIFGLISNALVVPKK